MKTVSRSIYLAFGVPTVIAALVACSDSRTTSPLPAQIARPLTHALAGNGYEVLYSFKGGTGDGEEPWAGLLNVNGTLYGTTYAGGGNSGTVFAITTPGKETVLDGFHGKKGSRPYSGLINVKGTLYGTTYFGGVNGEGTVFAITTAGKETVLHSFPTGSGDGEYPHAGLINVKGTLYGTTFGGGANGGGTVFSITPSRTETVLYSFKDGSGDGYFPNAGLINVKGALYGTTTAGGTRGYGTVFSTTTSGKETVLYRFKGGTDGEDPEAGLLDVNGTLYGTTYAGGSNCYDSSLGGCGTVFKVTTSGKENVLHTFGASGDGDYPDAGLINVNGTLYGTTAVEGANCSASGGCGTVFSITTSGTETVLHSFPTGPGDGYFPRAELINVKGTLYGTTEEGGANCSASGGCGTVFSLSP
jgi:uncharacterized repeat protein (TIGR03803 family)